MVEDQNLLFCDKKFPFFCMLRTSDDKHWFRCCKNRDVWFISFTISHTKSSQYFQIGTYQAQGYEAVGKQTPYDEQVLLFQGAKLQVKTIFGPTIMWLQAKRGTNLLHPVYNVDGKNVASVEVNQVDIFKIFPCISSC